MTPTDQAPLQAIALNAENGAPDWVQLTPPGPRISGRDGRSWVLDADALVAEFQRRGGEIVVDFEHATERKAPKGERADAAGFISALEVRDGGVWGQVAWNSEGQRAVEGRAYRYLSPVLMYDTRNGRVLRINTAGLTNTPNFQMTALNSEGAQQEPDPMDKAIRDALRLGADATTADAVVAINGLREERALALNSAQHPDPEKFVPVATYDVAMNRIAAFEEAEKTRKTTEIDAALDAAIEAGKIAPADRDFYASACNSEGGLDRFRSSMESRKPIVSALEPKKAPAGQAYALNAEQAYAARHLGLSVEDYQAAMKEEI